ncbi:hypothetical protein JOL79_06960 [Microbispora sp. RL4-1S]|uniref:Uncharacterized protein n=1 Tax=Microbispora oryzae TaxID=2806554 RepID=A0A940WF61_9ACTN|nr:hypothetical protein [Microbispora oryzae]MBP2703538.1 hypothetical protein [Microbispora oryzae]
MANLGCADEYKIGVFDRTGSRQLGELFDASALTWGRVVDDTSDAVVQVPYQGADCCGLLADAWPWCNEIVLVRDDLLVWQGPVETITYGREVTTITAKDVTAWLYHRVIKDLIDYSAAGAGPADLVLIAEALVRHGLDQDDPNVLQYLHTKLAGVTGERRYPANGSIVYDELAELARTGVDFTALGRRIIIAGEVPVARLPQLADEHFVGDLQVVKDGRQAATAATVVGKGVTATAGGIGPCGLLETLANEQEILDDISAQAEAVSIVQAGTFPVMLQVPDGAQLDPDAPVSINELIPGVVIPVTSSETCYTLSADLRLQRLQVTFDAGNGSDDGGGEQVRVTLVPVGAQFE